uniref:THAP domain-containing protein 1 n=1 Tax=Salarias fasciatus TaxID=181472 RepID=A0A672HJ97_SALFA
MGGCSAPNCSNSTSIGKQLFRFPKDAARKKKWVVNCRRDFEPTPHSRLCEVSSQRCSVYRLCVCSSGSFMGQGKRARCGLSAQNESCRPADARYSVFHL